MAKKRTCCIGWSKEMQRKKVQILSMAPAIGPDEAGRLLSIVESMHRARLYAIRRAATLKRLLLNRERYDYTAAKAGESRFRDDRRVTHPRRA